MIQANRIQTNLEAVRLRIAEAAKLSGRAAEDITLVVVTKGHPVTTLRILHDLGVHDLGESYVQEARAKHDELGDLPGLRWHMIGHVQSRKAEEVARHFDLVHAVDNFKVAGRLDRFAAQARKILPILLELNVSGEGNKYGWPAWDDTGFQAVIPEIEKVLQLPNVVVRGLMSMATMTSTSDAARPTFARTRALRDELRTRYPEKDWKQLSMGMSADFQAAIREGATLVRIGTSILGSRSA